MKPSKSYKSKPLPQPKKRIRVKKVKFKNNWELNSGFFFIHWIKDRAVAVQIEGQKFYSRTDLSPTTKRIKK